MELWHEQAGEGETVVLVHAGICDSRMWDPQWESFPAAHRTVALRPARLRADATAARALLARRRPGRVARATRRRPRRPRRRLLRRARLLSTWRWPGRIWSPGWSWSGHRSPGTSGRAPIQEFFEDEEDALGSDDIDGAVELNLRTWVDGPRRGPEAVYPELRRRVGEMQRRAFEHQLPVWEHAEDELLTEDLGERFREVAAPTLVVSGEDDVDDIAVIAERLAGGISGARRETIPGAAHLPSLERPAEFDRLVLGFLAG